MAVVELCKATLVSGGDRGEKFFVRCQIDVYVFSDTRTLPRVTVLTEMPRVETPVRATDGERALVDSLCDGDEAAFRQLVRDVTPAMLRVASSMLSTRAAAEEVVQESWINVLKGIHRFEGRSSLKTWILVIVGNNARRKAVQENKTVPISNLLDAGPGATDIGVPLDRFFASDHPRWAGMWVSVVRPWSTVPEERLLSGELRAVVRETIAALPRMQRDVIMLRDLNGLSAEEVCEVLELSDGNLRVLLHRARSAVREAVDRYLDGSETC